MKKILTKLFPILLGLSIFTGCASKMPDYTSSLNTSNLKGMIVTIGNDGTEIKSDFFIYRGNMVFSSSNEDLPYNEEDCTHKVLKTKDNIIVKHFNDGKVALLFDSGTIAYGEIIITDNKVDK